MYPADVVLFEGILAFYSQEVRDLFRMKLFVDTDADTRLSRRGEQGQNPPNCSGHLVTQAGASDQDWSWHKAAKSWGAFPAQCRVVTRAARGLLCVSWDSVGFLLPWLGFLL